MTSSYYEKIDGFTVCIDEKIPFALPDNWRWERLGNISTSARGGSPRPIEDYITESEDGINWIKLEIQNKAVNISPRRVRKSFLQDFLKHAM